MTILGYDVGRRVYGPPYEGRYTRPPLAQVLDSLCPRGTMKVEKGRPVNGSRSDPQRIPPLAGLDVETNFTVPVAFTVATPADVSNVTSPEAETE